MGVSTAALQVQESESARVDSTEAHDCGNSGSLDTWNPGSESIECTGTFATMDQAVESEKLTEGSIVACPKCRNRRANLRSGCPILEPTGSGLGKPGTSHNHLCEGRAACKISHRNAQRPPSRYQGAESAGIMHAVPHPNIHLASLKRGLTPIGSETRGPFPCDLWLKPSNKNCHFVLIGQELSRDSILTPWAPK